MEENNPLILHIISCMFSLLKTNIKSFLSKNPQSNVIYQKIQTLLMKCFEKYLNMKNPHKLITRNISDCFSILILGGVFCHWTECISDLIEMSKKSNNLKVCYIILRALADIDILIYYKKNYDNDDEDIKETQPLILLNGERLKLKGELIGNNKIVMKYIIDIFNVIETITDNENLKKELINAIFDTVRCWTNFELNMIKSEEIAKIIYFILYKYNIDNPERFSDLMIESISNSHNSKIYINIDAAKDSTPEQLSEKLFKEIDQEEKKGIDLLLDFLFKNLDSFNDNNIQNVSGYQRKLFIAYLKILSSIVENYIYLFFNFSDEKCVKLFEYFQFFIKNKKKKISSLFIEGLGEMRNFINNFYRFAGLNENQKYEFVNYFMDIFFGVLENCTYNKLDINDTSLLDKEILSKNNTLCLDKKSTRFNNSVSNNLEDKDSEYFDEMMTIDSYRNNVENVFSDIFFIIFENFGDDLSSVFLEKKIISTIYDKNIIMNNPKYASIVDVIFFVLYSLSENYEVLDSADELKSLKCIIKVIDDFLDSKIILENQRILIDLMVLINRYYIYFSKEQNTFFKVIRFLLQIAKNTNNEKIEKSCYILLSLISQEKKENMKDDYNLIEDIFKLFNEKYSMYNYKKILLLKNIMGIILSLLGINHNNSKNILSKEKIEFYKDITQKISFPINEKIEELLLKYENNISNNNNQEFLISEINKSYVIQGQIISLLDEFNLEIKNYYVQQYLNKFLFLTKKILQIFYNNSTVMENIYYFYEKIAKTMVNNYQNNIENLNELFTSFLVSDKGNQNYKIILILKELYLSLLQSTENNNQTLMIYNRYILEQYIIIIQNSIDKISKSNINSQSLKDRLKMLCIFHSEIFPKLIINQTTQNIYQLMKDLIMFLIKCITLLYNIEKEKEINEEYLIILIIKSFIGILDNKTFIINNNISSFINDSVIDLWNLIFFKQFNKTSRDKLVDYYFIVLKYDINNFCEIFKQLIGNNSQINSKIVKEIIEYLIIFKDNEQNSKKMINVIIEIYKGIGDWKTLSFLLTLSAKKKLK